MTTTIDPSLEVDLTDPNQQKLFPIEEPVEASPPPAPPSRPRRFRQWVAFIAAFTLIVAAFAAGRNTATETTRTLIASPRQAATPVIPQEQPADRIAAVAATVGPTVVQLETASGLGSGVIYNNSGLILTAAHVVEGEPSVAVRLADGRLFEGEILGTHEPTDIAVIAIDGSNLPTATLGYGDQLQVGELAVALGSPFGFDQTVTSGIVSSVNRTVNGVPMVQTDAAINPGNSGGPLVDGSGRVIGINDVIFSSGGGADGVGFAISIDVAIVVADQIVGGADVQLAILGVSAVQSTTGEPGAIIQSILDGSAAAAANLEVGDRIVAINNAPVQDPNDLFASIVRNRPGANVTIEVLRSGESIKLPAVLGAIEP